MERPSHLVEPADTNIFAGQGVAVFVDLYRKSVNASGLQDAELREKERLLSAEPALRESRSLRAPPGPPGRPSATVPRPSPCAPTSFATRWGEPAGEQPLQLRVQDVSHAQDLAELVSTLHRLLADDRRELRRESRYLRDGTVFWATSAQGRCSMRPEGRSTSSWRSRMTRVAQKPG